LQSKDDTSAVTVRNPDYWQEGRPYLDGVRILGITDPQSEWAAFLARQIHVVVVPGRETKRFLDEQSKNYFTDWFSDITVQQIWQNTRRKPFDDARVNRALRLLVDHTEAIKGWAEVWFGRGSFQGSAHLPHSLQAWDFAESEYASMLEWKQPKDEAAREALSLLSAAGFTRDNPLKFVLSAVNIPFSQAGSELLQAQYLRLGQGVIQPDFKVLDNVSHINAMAQGDFEFAGPIARASFFEPDQVFRSIYYSTGAQNYGKYSDPRLDQMIDQQRAIFDTAQRKAAVREINRYLIEHAPYTGWSSRDQLNAAHPQVKDFVPESAFVVPAYQYAQVWLDT
jgi:peptide/nickel transport system substrate-binding protein